jgi:hypothetical protein
VFGIVVGEISGTVVDARRSLILETKKQIGPLAVQGEQQKVEKRHQSQQPPNRNGKTEH